MASAAPQRSQAGFISSNLGRAANGKADYKSVTEFAKRQLGVG